MKDLIASLLIVASWLLVLIVDQSAASCAHWIFPAIWCLLLYRTHRSGDQHIAYLSYMTFFLMSLADGIGFANQDFNALCSYLAFTLSFFFFLCFIRQAQDRSGIRSAPALNLVSTLALSVLPLTFIIHTVDLGTTFSKDIVFAMMATNVNESIEFGLSNLSAFWIFLAILFIAAIAALSFRKPPTTRARTSLARPLVLFIVFATLSILQPEHLRLYYEPISSVRQYQREMSRFIELQQQFQLDDPEFEASKAEHGETYVIVIGESLNKEHMSLYGYPRATTPRLDAHSQADGFLKFSNAFSSHTHTSESLSFALTEANQRNEKKYFESASICNILSKADVENIWITNQSLHGEWDNITSAIAHQSDNLISYNHWVGSSVRQNHYDEVLLEPYAAILAQPSDQTRVIFIHLLGNHWRYSDRYPESYNLFPQADTATDRWSDRSPEHQRSINEYDNSIAYNDYVVSTALSLLKEKEGVTAFLYVSDHGEDVDAGLKHHSGNFTIEMVKIPLMLWLSESYRERYPDKSAAIREKVDTLYCNDALYDTLIGLFNIETPRYEAVNNLFSDEYRLNPEDAYTLHGQFKIPLDAMRTAQNDKQ